MSDKQCINIQGFLNGHPFSTFQWIIFALGFVIVLLDGFDTAAIGYIAPSLLKEWGISKPDLAPVLSAALFGLAAGALGAGPLADRFGRKRVLIASVGFFGIASLVSAYAASLDQLTLLRFATGLGLGAAMPNAITLMSEYCPDRRRAMLTNAMFCGFPLGAALGGFVAAWMIPLWGWRSVLILGGVLPIGLTVLLLFLLPESVRYLVSKGLSMDAVRAILSKISPTAQHATSFVMSEDVRHQVHETTPGKTRSGVSLVLSRGYIAGSLALWVAYFMGLVMFYALVNWMPVLLKDAGLDPKQATLVSALFPLGGIGAIVFGWLMDRFNGNRIISVGYLLSAVAIGCIGQAAGHLGLLMAVVFLAGVMVNTSQVSMPSLAAAFYPTRGRATGVAWMLGIGRFGGIAGSFLVAELTRRQLGFDQIFLLIAVPGLIAAVALLAKQFCHPERTMAAVPEEALGLGH
jgi:AAHS family 4-hydroxybenzoate transporter-like MFS transporter